MSQFPYSLEDSFYFLVCYERKKAQTHNGITMKRVRHVISLLRLTGGKKKGEKRVKDIRQGEKSQQAERKIPKKTDFSFAQLVYNSQSLAFFC